MRRFLFLTIVVCLGCTLSAQIGINTEAPQKLFHVDAKRNTSGSTNVSDDVVVDNNGNIGVGTISPTTKLHIETTQTGLPALHFSDGNEGPGKVLGSKDANGNITWLAPPSSWAKAFYTTGTKSYKNTLRHLFFSTQVPLAGTYVVVLRWWGRANVTNPIISAYIHVVEGVDNVSGSSKDIGRDNIEYYVKYPVANSVFTFTTTLKVQLSQNNRWIKVYLTPATPINVSYNWNVGMNGTDRNYNPSILIFKI